ncbi:ABC transporter permease, partial [Xanthomonas citri pv. citri]|nr:ABC transporter permease [Xanthomonas citri pv. citri]
LSLTALTPGAYLAGKCLVALAMAALPVLAVLAAGALTGAELIGPLRWLTTGALALVSSLPFALFGLAAALLFRSEAAVSAASGILVVFGFLG